MLQMLQIDDKELPHLHKVFLYKVRYDHWFKLHPYSLFLTNDSFIFIKSYIGASIFH